MRAEAKCIQTGIVRDYENTNCHALNKDLSQAHWDNTVFNFDNINEIYIQTFFNNCSEIIFDKITVRRRGKEYMNASLREFMGKSK